MEIRSTRALHFDRYEDTSGLHFFLFSKTGPDREQPAAFQSRKASRLRQQRVDKKASLMRRRVPWFDGLRCGMVEAAVEMSDLET